MKTFADDVSSRADRSSREKDESVAKPTITLPEKTTTPRLFYHLETIWLFTHSDLISIILPQTIFGLSSALSGSLLTTNPSPSYTRIICRTPYILAWIWLNLLHLCIANQRLPSSISEDALNKPWRPLPSRRLTPRTATRLLVLLIPIVLYVCKYQIVDEAGTGFAASVALLLLNWVYNDLDAANEHYIVRNLLNAFGFVAFGVGATAVAASGDGVEVTLAPRAWIWNVIVGAVIFTTIQLQDLYDQEGDAARGRSTAPLVLGDGLARVFVALPLAFWSVVCPLFWGLGVSGCFFPCAFGSVIVGRTYLYRTAAEDRITFRVWCAWAVSLYLLPLRAAAERAEIYGLR